MRMTRRSLLRGETGNSVHISSLVVHCRPDVVEEVITRINTFPDAEVPEHSAEGKLVVLLETSNQGRIMERISAIENFTGVINAALVYHQIDTETGNPS